jgi:hypothetical protein
MPRIYKSKNKRAKIHSRQQREKFHMTTRDRPAITTSEEPWRRRVGLAMKVEFLCVLDSWIEADEDFEGLSPQALVSRIDSRLRMVASRMQPSPQEIDLRHLDIAG